MTELLFRRLLDPDGVVPTRAYAGDAGLDLASAEHHRPHSALGSAPSSRPGSRLRFPKATPGWWCRGRGSPSRHGITIVNAPGLVDSGYRGEVRVILLNTDRSETFVVEPGMRIAQLVVVAVRRARASRGRELPASGAGVRGFGSSSRAD